MFKMKENFGLNNNELSELNLLAKQCKLTGQEKKRLADICKECNLSPLRVAETIGINSRGGRILKEILKRYEDTIKYLKNRINDDEKKLKEAKGDGKEKEELKITIKENKERMKNYKLAYDVLKEAEGNTLLQQKIYNNTNFKPISEIQQQESKA